MAVQHPHLTRALSVLEGNLYERKPSICLCPLGLRGTLLSAKQAKASETFNSPPVPAQGHIALYPTKAILTLTHGFQKRCTKSETPHGGEIEFGKPIIISGGIVEVVIYAFEKNNLYFLMLSMFLIAL